MIFCLEDGSTAKAVVRLRIRYAPLPLYTQWPRLNPFEGCSIRTRNLCVTSKSNRKAALFTDCCPRHYPFHSVVTSALRCKHLTTGIHKRRNAAPSLASELFSEAHVAVTGNGVGMLWTADMYALESRSTDIADKMENRMCEYEFTLTFNLPHGQDDPVQHLDPLFDAGCDDALVATGTTGIISLAFNRDAVSEDQAIESAIKSVMTAIPDASLIKTDKVDE